jgi:hypothetical protein
VPDDSVTFTPTGAGNYFPVSYTASGIPYVAIAGQFTTQDPGFVGAWAIVWVVDTTTNLSVGFRMDILVDHTGAFSGNVYMPGVTFPIAARIDLEVWDDNYVNMLASASNGPAAMTGN